MISIEMLWWVKKREIDKDEVERCLGIIKEMVEEIKEFSKTEKG